MNKENIFTIIVSLGFGLGFGLALSSMEHWLVSIVAGLVVTILSLIIGSTS